jgi:hypothetical protein
MVIQFSSNPVVHKHTRSITDIMSTRFKILIFFIILCFTRQSVVGAKGSDGWELKKKQDGIEVYLRDVPGPGLKEFKGIMYVKGVRLSSMVATFDDTASYPRWMHNCTESRLLKYMNVQERITYTVTHAPWPANDRDTVVYSLMSQNPDDLSVTIAITSKPDYIPKQRHRLRIPMMKASWTFKPLKSGTVMIVYQTITDPGGPLPLWLLNLSIIDLPYYTMYKFRNVIKEYKYAAARYLVVEEPIVN